MRVPISLRTVALAATVALSVAACGDGDTTATPGPAGTPGTAPAFDLVNEGVLTVCSDIPYAPFEFEDPERPGEYTGYDIDLMRASSDRLGLQLEVVVTSFDAIRSGTAMAADQCDVAASAITITAERDENLDFTDPYFNADQSLLVRTDDRETHASLQDLAGQSIGVQSATTGEEYAQENKPEGATITTYEDAGALFTALTAGEIDAILQDFPVNAYQATQDESVVVVERFATGEQYGFAVAEGDTELRDAINEVLHDLEGDNEFAEIHRRYFGEDPPDDLL
ncbi:MAG: transporter substrate-binding domain-containing protein [Actinobacteria bacterium]|nr:transporter substrate-binding domain-containing protein [Actinomycetota bacterium]